MRTTLAVLLTGLSALSASAGIYGPDERILIPVRADGVAEELSFGFDPPGRFNLALDRLADMGDLNPKRTNNKQREDVLARIASRKGDPASAADLIRTRQADAAINLIAPKARGRTATFAILSNLAHAHAIRGEWADAVRWHEAALLDADYPKELPGATPAQRNWLLKVEKDYYRKWLTIHRDEAAKRLPADKEEVFPLFPVKWVGEGGQYEPGTLAKAEKAKLPADAIPVVQQLLLWQRDDTRLYWLLGELYAADGRLREAEIIFDQCASESRLYSNRKIMMDHRAAVKRAVELLPKPVIDVPPPPPVVGIEDLGVSRERLIAVGAGFAAVAVGLLVLQVRRMRRR